MTERQITQLRVELLREHPGASIKISPDRAEVVAEIEPKRAIAVIERSFRNFMQGPGRFITA